MFRILIKLLMQVLVNLTPQLLPLHQFLTVDFSHLHPLGEYCTCNLYCIFWCPCISFLSSINHSFKVLSSVPFFLFSVQASQATPMTSRRTSALPTPLRSGKSLNSRSDVTMYLTLISVFCSSEQSLKLALFQFLPLP